MSTALTNSSRSCGVIFFAFLRTYLQEASAAPFPAAPAGAVGITGVGCIAGSMPGIAGGIVVGAVGTCIGAAAEAPPIGAVATIGTPTGGGSVVIGAGPSGAPSPTCD